MPRLPLSLLLSGVLSLSCGSDESGGGGGASGSGGSGASQGTTCADGYPKVGTACAIVYEKCTSCGSFPCCDIFECQQGSWAQTQFHTKCPSDGGTDSASDASDGDATDASTD